MNEAQIYETLTEIFRDRFEDDTLVLHAGTSAADVPGWDSLAHVQLLVEVEMKLGVKFNTTDIESMKNVGDLVRMLATKRKR